MTSIFKKAALFAIVACAALPTAARADADSDGHKCMAAADASDAVNAAVYCGEAAQEYAALAYQTPRFHDVYIELESESLAYAGQGHAEFDAAKARAQLNTAIRLAQRLPSNAHRVSMLTRFRSMLAAVPH